MAWLNTYRDLVVSLVRGVSIELQRQGKSKINLLSTLLQLAVVAGLLDQIKELLRQSRVGLGPGCVVGIGHCLDDRDRIGGSGRSILGLGDGWLGVLADVSGRLAIRGFTALARRSSALDVALIFALEVLLQLLPGLPGASNFLETHLCTSAEVLPLAWKRSQEEKSLTELRLT